MSATLEQIRRGMATNLAQLEPGVQVSAYILAAPTPPCLWVRPSTEDPLTYHRAMSDGSEDWPMLVQAYTGTGGGDLAAQMKLDELIVSTGPKSVKALLEADPTLGGLVDDLVVQTCRGYLEYARSDGSTLFGAEWTVLVLNGSS